MSKTKFENALQRLLALAAAKDMSQKELARRMGLSGAALTNWKTRGVIPPDRLEDAADVVGVSPHFLRYGVEAGAEEPRQEANGYSKTRVRLLGSIEVREDGSFEFLSPDEAAGFIDGMSSDPEAYAMRIQGGVAGTPIVSNWYMVIEPNRPPAAEDLVMVELLDGTRRIFSFLTRRDDMVLLEELLPCEETEVPSRHRLDPSRIKAIHSIGYLASPAKWRSSRN